MEAGFQHRPRWTYLLAAVFVLSPFFNIASSLFLEGVAHWYLPLIWWAAFGSIPIQEQVIQTLIFTAGVSLILVRRGAWIIAVSAVALTILNTIVVALRSGEDIISHAFFSLVTLAALFVILSPRVRTLYFDPRKRWWESASRFKIGEHRVELSEIGSSAELVDLSMTGALLKFSSEKEAAKAMPMGSLSRAELDFFRFSLVLKCVRAHEEYRGVMFHDLSPLAFFRIWQWVKDNRSSQRR